MVNDKKMCGWKKGIDLVHHRSLYPQEKAVPLFLFVEWD